MVAVFLELYLSGYMTLVLFGEEVARCRKETRIVSEGTVWS